MTLDESHNEAAMIDIVHGDSGVLIYDETQVVAPPGGWQMTVTWGREPTSGRKRRQQRAMAEVDVLIWNIMNAEVDP